MLLNLDIQIATQYPILPAAIELIAWVITALPKPFTETELTIRIVDEDEIQSLNAEWRGKNYPTNVLSFPFECPPEIDLPLLGDIVICAPVIMREAQEQGKTSEAHWAHLIIHSTLHLLGYDHETDTEQQEMENIEITLLKTLGYANPYEENA